MLSRVANSVYWMFRYLERAENIARFINADFNQYLEDHRRQGNLWGSLLAVTGDTAAFEERYQGFNKDNVIHFLTVDEAYSNSIYQSVQQSRENARSIREIISIEMWEEINGLFHMVKDYKNSRGLQDPYKFCKTVLQSSYLILGLFYSTMNRSDAWHFARMGMLLERADKTSRILDVKYFILLPEPSLVGSVYDQTQWSALLKAVSGLEMYRKEYRRITPKNVAEFLIFDRLFPRSMYHCMHYAVNSLNHVSGYIPHKPINEAQRSLFRLQNLLETGEIEPILDRGLHEYLDDLQEQMNVVDGKIYQVFFGNKIPREIRGGTYGNQGQSQS
jgi:uncharacterized alpha-E superfamily protein